MQIWDCSGQEKYKGLIPTYVRNSFIVFLIYDVSAKSSFNNISNWINFIRSIENTTLVLCGNKIDLGNREVKKEEGVALAQKEGIAFFEVSAKTKDGINDMFHDPVNKKLVKELLQENENENETNLMLIDDHDLNTERCSLCSRCIDCCKKCCKNCFNSDEEN